MRSGERDRINALIDWDAVFDRATRSFKVPDDALRDLRAGILKSVQSEQGAAAQWANHARSGWRSRFLRQRSRDGHPTALLRLNMPQAIGGTVNYIEFLIRPEPGGKVRAIDFYIYMTGEFLSETLRRGLLPVVADLSRGFFNKLIGSSSDYIQDLPRLEQVTQAIARKENQRALDLIRQLRPGTLKEKSVQLMRIVALQQHDEKAYGDALAEFRESFPNEACVDFLSIDYHVLKGDYAKARESVDRLDRSLGGDPYLDTLRGNFASAEKRPEEAHRLYLQAVRRDPELVEGYVLLADHAFLAKKYGQVVDWLKKVDALAPEQIDGMLDREAYADFLASPEYQDWLSYLKEKPATPAKTDGRERAPQGEPSP